MERLAEIASRSKILIIAFVVLATIAGGYMLTKLEMDNDIVSFLPQDDPDVIVFTDTGEKFGSNYQNMVVLQTNDVFTYENLSLIKKITGSLEEFTGIDQVISLTNILDVKQIEGGLDVSKLIEGGKIPKDIAELAKLKTYTLSKEMYRGSIVNSKGDTAVIVVRLRNDADKEAISRDIEKTVMAMVSDKKDIKAYFGGMPAAMYYMNLAVSNDLIFLIPMVSLLIIFTLWMGFRTVRGVVLPLLTVLISTILSVGLMAVFGIPITMLSSILPIILLSTGTAYGIHLVNADREVAISGITNPQKRVFTALSKVGAPIVLSALTTIFGFASLVTAELKPIREFGIFVAIGIFLALMLTLFLGSSLLEIWPASLKKKKTTTADMEKKAINTGFDKALVKISDFVFKKPIYIVVVALVIALLGSAGIPYISQEVNMSLYFPENSPVRQAERIMEQEFGGSTPIVVDFKAKDIKHPAVLRLMQRIQKKLRVTPHIKNPQGVTDLMMEMNEIMNSCRATPETVEGVENLWLFIDGKKELKQMVDEPKSEAIVQAMVDDSNTATIVASKNAVHEMAASCAKQWSSLKKSELDANKQESLASIYIPEVVDEIKDDLAFAGITIDKSVLEKELRRILKLPSLPTTIWNKTISTSLSVFLASETADIEIEDQSIRKDVTASLVALPEWSEDKARNILVNKLPKEILDEDPEALDALLDSLDTVWNYAEKETIIAVMLKALDDSIPSSLSSLDKVVFERVEGDLWQLVEDTVWLSAEQYKTVTGSAPTQIVDIEVTDTGFVKILGNIVTRLLRSQMQSMAIALLLVFLLLAIQLRSFTGGLLSMIPIIFTILFNFGLMSLLKIPLDNATMMIGSIAIGIGVDYTIHVISRFKKEYLVCMDVRIALEKTITTTGRAILINSVAVMMGFLVLGFSELEPIRRFGYLTAVTMLVSATAALTIFPATVLVTKAKFMMRVTNNQSALNSDEAVSQHQTKEI